jgi:hypothetical protein
MMKRQVDKMNEYQITKLTLKIADYLDSRHFYPFE